jgi:hypothetical protein
VKAALKRIRFFREGEMGTVNRYHTPFVARPVNAVRSFEWVVLVLGWDCGLFHRPRMEACDPPVSIGLGSAITGRGLSR